MNDKKIAKNIKIFTLLIVLLSVIFLVGGLFLNVMIRNAGVESAKVELMNNTTLYETQLLQQFEADFQTLNTVKVFIDFEHEGVDEALLAGLNESNRNNRFIRMSLCYSDGVIYHATLNEEITKDKVENLPEVVQESLNKSWNGEEAVSKFYYDEQLQETVTVVSVPVYKNNKIIGVLAAYDSVNEFKAIISKNDNVNSYTHLVSSTGNFLIRSDNRINEDEATSIYNMSANYLDEAEVKKALANKQDYYATFEKNDKTYCVYFKYLDVNDWYLFNITPLYSVESDMALLVQYSTVIYMAIIAIGAPFLFYIFKMIRKNDSLMAKQAYHDNLTNLLNFSHFKHELRNLLKSDVEGYLAVLNIKNFQFINETFGEKSADNLLCFVANCMKQQSKQEELSCRENADQFIMLFKEKDLEVVKERLMHIEEQIKRFFADNKYNYDIQLSIGICKIKQTDKPVADVQWVIYNAQWAMKKAKQTNEGCIVFDEQLMKTIQIQNEIESSMQYALKNEEFKLFIQPKYDVFHDKLVGGEALVRWIRNDGTMFYPDQFIPLFEKNGFCVDLDLYMVENVCKQLRKWIDDGKMVYPISINQTKRLFYHSDYVEKLQSIFNKYQISPDLIILEVLEGLAIEDLDSFNRCIERLHAIGLKVSLDDFGSGYSSLSNLNELNVDEIKIDRGFIMSLKGNDESQETKIFKQIISLVSTLDSDVIVEGVETKEHIEILKSMNCRFAQGYFFSKPIQSSEFEKLLDIQETHK